MSLFKAINVTCPYCAESIAIDAVGSVNADRRPDFRDAILDNTFQVTTCPKCANSFRIEPDFNYLDMGRGQWIAGLPARNMPEFETREIAAQQDFDRAYGVGASPSAQEIGATLEMRLAFGWPAVREKIVINNSGLDDKIIELMKIDLLRRLPSVNLTRGTELRVGNIDDETINFVWIDADTEKVAQDIGVRRALYDEIAKNTEGWAPLAKQISAGPFLDAQRLYIGV